jgi:hypothetical protein
MNEVERLLAIEEIKQLKAKYFLGIDTHDWDLWRREVWAPDAKLEVPELNSCVEGRDTLVDWVKERSANQVSVHHGHMPIIELTSETTAKGLWAMEDRIYRPKDHPDYADGAFILGFGHYHETYVKLDIGWRIASTLLTRLRVTRHRIS